MIRKIITALILLLLLLIAGVSLYHKANFSLPPKLIVMFILILIAAVALRFKLYWLRPFLLVTSVAYLGFYEGSCLCPNGALQNIFMYIGMERYGKIPFYAFEILLLFLLVFLLGNLYCGWVCHKGGIQEFLYRPSFAIKVPEKLDYWLKKMRYVFLGLAILYPVLYKHKVFCKYDPFKALFNLEGSTVLIILLGVLLISSIFIYRPYCRYVCPLGAILGIVNSIGLFKIDFTSKNECLNCIICENKCLLGSIRARGLDRVIVNRTLCFACMECSRGCPKRVLEENNLLRIFPEKKKFSVK